MADEIPRQRVQEPSRDLCAGQCGARCCHGMVAFLLDEEAQRLMVLNASAWIRPASPLEMLSDTRYLRTWIMDFRNGACAFLQADKSCGIYAERPMACRAFPIRAHPGCLVWPTQMPQPEPVAQT